LCDIKIPQVYSPGEEGEAEAWELLAYACYQCEWPR